jgi:hypothetical protein
MQPSARQTPARQPTAEEIDGERGGRIAFGEVYRVIGGAIDKHLRQVAFQTGAGFAGFGQIQVRAREADGVLTQDAEKGLTELAVGTEDGVFQEGYLTAQWNNSWIGSASATGSGWLSGPGMRVLRSMPRAW